MSFGRAVLAAFIGGLLAIVFALAWRASKETGKSIPASIPDVPAEAQKIVSDVKQRAATTAEEVKARAVAAAEDVKSRATEAISTGLETIREKEAALKDRIVGHGTAEEAGAAETAETW